MSTYPKVGWQSGQGPHLYPGLVQMDDGIESAHVEIDDANSTIAALQAQNTLPTIADLKAQSGQANNDTRNVLGYATPGDGGGGLFRWSSTSISPDDAGIVISPNSSPATGRWIRVYDGPISVLWFRGALSNQPVSGNYIRYSQQMDDPTWTLPLGGTVSANTDVAPDATTTVDRVTITSAFQIARQAVRGLVPGRTYTFSAYLATTTGTASIGFSVGGGAGQYVVADTTLTRYWVQLTPPTSGGDFFDFVDIAFAEVGTFKIWGVQLNPTASIQSYTPTTDTPMLSYDDWSSTVQAASTASRRASTSLRFPAGYYYLASDVALARGAHWESETWTHLDAFAPGMSVFVLRGAQIQLEQDCAIEGFTLYYDRQRYRIDADGSQPDGLQAFTTYTPTFRWKFACSVKRIHYIGGSHFGTEETTAGQPGGLTLSDLWGYPLKVGIEVTWAADLLRIHNVNFNPSQYSYFISGSTTNYFTKCSKNATMFRFGFCDGAHMSNIFAFGCREFIHLANLSATDARDSNNDIGLKLSNFGADNCHTLIRYERIWSKNFGVALSNGFASPTIYNPVVGGVVSAAGPCVVRIDPGGQDGLFELSNCSFASNGPVPQITDSNFPANMYIISATAGLRNYILANNAQHRGYTAGIVSGATATNLVKFVGCMNNDAFTNGEAVVLGADVANSANNVFADVTGLSFPVASGVTYRFRALILYDAAATTTGSRWALSGPATPTRLAYTVTAPTPAAVSAVAAQVQQQNQYNTYDASAVGAFSPFTTGNLAVINGVITPSATGTLVVRFASEVNGSAITAKAGSTLEWW